MPHKPIRRVVTGHDGKNVAKVIREGAAANTKTAARRRRLDADVVHRLDAGRHRHR